MIELSNKKIANVMVNRIWMDVLKAVTGKHRDSYEQELNDAEQRGVVKAHDLAVKEWKVAIDKGCGTSAAFGCVLAALYELAASYEEQEPE